jgi:hypothetical protein
MSSNPIAGRGLKIEYPVFQEETYKKQLLNFVCKFERLTADFLTQAAFQSSYRHAIRHDDIIDDLEYYIRVLNTAISIESAKIIQTLSKHFTAVKKFTQRSFLKSFDHLTQSATAELASFSAAIPTTDIKLLKKMWIEKNTQLIKNIPADSLIKVNDAIYEALRNGELMQSLTLKIHKIFESTKKRATIIARD